MNFDRKAFVSAKTINMNYVSSNGSASSVKFTPLDFSIEKGTVVVSMVNDNNYSSELVQSNHNSLCIDCRPNHFEIELEKAEVFSYYQADSSLKNKAKTFCYIKSHNKAYSIKQFALSGISMITNHPVVYSKPFLSDVISVVVVDGNASISKPDIDKTVLVNVEDKTKEIYGNQYFINTSVVATVLPFEKTKSNVKNTFKPTNVSTIEVYNCKHELEELHINNNSVLVYDKPVNTLSKTFVSKVESFSSPFGKNVYTDVFKTFVYEKQPFSFDGISALATVNCYDETYVEPPTNTTTGGTSGPIKLYITSQKNNFLQFKIDGIVKSVLGLPNDLIYENNYIKGVITKSGEYIVKVTLQDDSTITYIITVPYYQRLL